MPYKNYKDQLAAGRRAHHRKMKDPRWASRRRMQARENYKRHGKAYRERIKRNYHQKHPPILGICPICGYDGKLQWDHNHKTGMFRDYVCRSCNLAMGHVKDNIETVNRLKEYLEKHS